MNTNFNRIPWKHLSQGTLRTYDESIPNTRKGPSPKHLKQEKDIDKAEREFCLNCKKAECKYGTCAALKELRRSYGKVNVYD